MSLIHITVVLALASLLAPGPQKGHDQKPVNDVVKPVTASGSNTAAEDISGMYSFLQEGEFVQINLEKNGVSGYISKMGTLESDKGAFLDLFFTKAAVIGHDVSFTTRPVHGIWYEFKGSFARGSAKTKDDDGYYVVRGTLTEFSMDAAKQNTSSHSRAVEFKSLAQPDDDQ